jgi:hypothetical protein
VGLDAFKVDGTESSLQQVFEADQANLLMKQLKDTMVRASLLRPAF